MNKFVFGSMLIRVAGRDARISEDADVLVTRPPNAITKLTLPALCDGSWQGQRFD